MPVSVSGSLCFVPLFVKNGTVFFKLWPPNGARKITGYDRHTFIVLMKITPERVKSQKYKRAPEYRPKVANM